ncbi:unnamed protein product [Nippostrongylus brasiliensis]|uniref:Reverse transcriptase domain-containing protein n=1 Tax=Nippostrongylus brasiliensis TaxID=27835 RepID=A0A0N4YSC1_NIPBR|nr:unnamed protein product [Nippostrongylus brasiliensis]
MVRLIGVFREYKAPLCLTFIDLKKVFDSVETEAVIEALCQQGVSAQYVKSFEWRLQRHTELQATSTVENQRRSRMGQVVEDQVGRTRNAIS